MQDEFLRLQSLLKKTIVFITHDFDEALRLADRIAIMFNGSIEQIGKPGQIFVLLRVVSERSMARDGCSS